MVRETACTLVYIENKARRTGRIIVPRSKMQAHRKLLGRFEIDDQLADSIDRSGLLEVLFSPTRSDAHLLSLDGNKTVAWLTPPGTIGSILVQDYVDAEGVRIVPFELGSLEIVNDGCTISIFFTPARAS